MPCGVQTSPLTVRVVTSDLLSQGNGKLSPALEFSLGFKRFLDLSLATTLCRSLLKRPQDKDWLRSFMPGMH